MSEKHNKLSYLFTKKRTKLFICFKKTKKFQKNMCLLFCWENSTGKQHKNPNMPWEKDKMFIKLTVSAKKKAACKNRRKFIQIIENPSQPIKTTCLKKYFWKKTHKMFISFPKTLQKKVQSSKRKAKNIDFINVQKNTKIQRKHYKKNRVFEKNVNGEKNLGVTILSTH